MNMFTYSALLLTSAVIHKQIIENYWFVTAVQSSNLSVFLCILREKETLQCNLPFANLFCACNTSFSANILVGYYYRSLVRLKRLQGES